MGGNSSLRYDRAFAIVSLVAVIAVGFGASAERSSAQTRPRVILFVVDTSTSAAKPVLALFARSARLCCTTPRFPNASNCAPAVRSTPR